MQEKIKPIYQQLMGILSQTPNFDNPHSTISTSEIWEHYNAIVDSLSAVSGKDYGQFKIEPKWQEWNRGSGHNVVNGTFFRQKLNGLINHLHGEYFTNERAPFSGEPQNVFEQNQVVTQNTNIEVLMMTVLEVQERLIKEESKYPPDSPEGNFIKKLKDALKGVKSNIDLIITILQTAIAVGLSIEKLKNIFK